MYRKATSLVLLLVLTISIFLPMVSASHAESSWWDKDWNYRQKIEIPITSNIEHLRNQPIDIKMTFKNKCWTQSETETSIRVCQWDGVEWNELESQIYDLKFSQVGKYIEGCGIVFLIPGDATGKETYYVYYDENEKTKTNYPDHVNIEEKFLYQEPIPGQKINVKFYAIKQEEFYTYYVAQEGELLDQPLSQNIVKLIDGTKKITPDTLEQFLQLSYSYYYGCTDDDFSSTGEKLVAKKIDVDGNLMVKFTISSKSDRGEIASTNTYTYYYCPTSDKRIRAHVRHEFLKDQDLPECVFYWDGSFGTLSSFKFKSNAIKELNFGKILPYLHIYGEDGVVREYKLDENPYYKISKKFLMNEEDVDLGEEAWVSFDGADKTHAVLLSSNKNIVKQGSGERDGIQVKGFQVELINIPGLEADFTQVHLMRNAYENGVYDLQVPGDLVVEFDAEFFTSDTINYEKMGQEAEIFQSLAKLNPTDGEQYSSDNSENNGEKFTLTVFAHAAPSFPLGNLLSVLTGKNLSYISAEIYREGDLVSTGVVSHIKTESDINLNEEDTSPLQKIKMYWSLLDLRNSSIFKKIEFDNLPPGKYVVKIYREHPPSRQEREIIGLEIIELKENATTHIFCKREGSVQVSLVDQNKNNIENAKVYVFLDNYCVTESFTDENGEVLINLPYKKKSSPYNLKVFYNGFKIYDESFNLKFLRLSKPIVLSLEIPLYSIKFKIVDTFGFTPGIKLTPTIKSSDAEEPVILRASETKDNVYTFNNLYPSSYNFKVDYKTFKIERTFKIPSNKDTIDIEFPAKFDVKINVFDSFGVPLKDTKVFVNRNTKDLEDKTNDKGATAFSLPPGEYGIKSFENEAKLMVTGEEEINVVTEKTPVIFSYVILISILFIVVMSTLFFLKKISLHTFVKAIPIILLITALIMPWWQLSGSAQDMSVDHEINTYPLSQKIISKTTVDGNSYLEISTAPEIVEQFLMIVLILTMICILCVAFSIVFEVLEKPRMEKLLVYSSIVLTIIVIVIFIYGMNQLSTIGIGSMYGEGILSIDIPYSADCVNINASWYMAIGFYLCILSILALITPRILIKKLYWGKE